MQKGGRGENVKEAGEKFSRIGSRHARWERGGVALVFPFSPLHIVACTYTRPRTYHVYVHKDGKIKLQNKGGGERAHEKFSRTELKRIVLYFLQQQLAETGRKQLEQLMHQLQEQLQINLLQQTHMMQAAAAAAAASGGGEKANKGSTAATAALQQLQIQQQQLISQLQLVQQRILMVSSKNSFNATIPLHCLWEAFSPFRGFFSLKSFFNLK